MMKTFLKKTLIVLSLLCGLIRCVSKEEEEVTVPSNILSDSLFTKVLVDFALAESAANLNIKNTPNNRYDTVYAFDPLKENHITRSKYDSTLMFYAHNTKLYRKIYEGVLASLSEMQTRRDSIRTDSVSTVKKP
ncbi:MAG: DUF4296 domain-containing protein [Bacteroidota bacterium]